MVGIVLVSHSKALATAVKELVVAMAGPTLPLRVAAGAGENHAELGTDATDILDAINEVMSEDGVLILMDIGSAILSAETALGFLDDSQRARVRCCAAPFVEGAVAAGVRASLGSPLEEVVCEAETALHHKQEHLQPDDGEKIPVAKTQPAPESDADSARSIRVMVRNSHGLHARPAARLIQEAVGFRAQIELRNVTGKRGPAPLKSLSGIVSLEVMEGHEIEITARGADAGEALQALKEAVESGLGESIGEGASSPLVKDAPDSRIVSAVSGGIAIGPLYFSHAAEIDLPPSQGADPETELRALHAAIAKAKSALSHAVTKLKASLGKNEADILKAQALVLDDPALLESAEAAIQKDRENAPRAWRRAYQKVADSFEKLGDEYIRQRAADVRDVGLRVLEAFGFPSPEITALPSPGILVVNDLSPSDVTNLSLEKVRGVILLQGGKTSHAAILLRARGVPAIARAKAEFDHAGVRPSQGEIMAAIDGDLGKLWLSPDAATLKMLEDLRAAQDRETNEETRRSAERAITSDGRHVPIWANLGSAAEAASALEHGAEGVGLFRTEFLFLHHENAPNEEEQFNALRAVREAMGERPVIIRTLDIGGDKEAPYLGMPKEANPFLGVRAIRLCLNRPDIFQPHLRAILRAGLGGDFRIMFPMIADAVEFRQARSALEEAHKALVAENRPHLWPLPVGIMIETPSAAILIDQLAPIVDFFSIGANDLTQYLLAADRGNPELAHFQDALHPAVLRQIQRVTKTAHAHGKDVGVCGESASDPDAARILIGLGVDDLSMTPARIPKIKAAIRSSSKQELEALAAKAMSLGNAAEVRALLANSNVTK
jgi:phosphoenolpyruvate-protein phosphotransferase/dihydroxyacetone kinase phosphotransfer subunit